MLTSVFIFFSSVTAAWSTWIHSLSWVGTRPLRICRWVSGCIPLCSTATQLQSNTVLAGQSSHFQTPSVFAGKYCSDLRLGVSRLLVIMLSSWLYVGSYTLLNSHVIMSWPPPKDHAALTISCVCHSGLFFFFFFSSVTAAWSAWIHSLSRVGTSPLRISRWVSGRIPLCSTPTQLQSNTVLAGPSSHFQIPSIFAGKHCSDLRLHGSKLLVVLLSSWLCRFLYTWI